MTQPSVSVVIPSHMRPILVNRAAVSALAQTLQDLEVIVVLDGADPLDDEGFAQVRDPRLRVISLPQPVGGSEARNIGVRAARADWIAFLDDDDEWMPSKLAKQMSVVRACTYQYPIVATALIARSPLADFRWPRRAPRSPVSEYLFVRNSLFQGEAILQTSTWLTRRELLLKIPFTRGLRRHQDWDWILRAVKEPGVGLEFIDEPLVIWYIDDPNSAIRTHYHWEYSLNWIKANRELVTPKAYSSFAAVTLSAQAAWQNDWKAFGPLLRETLFRGKPRLLDLAMFFAMWFVPRRIRQRVRAIMTRSRSKKGMPAGKQLEPDF